MIAYNYKKISRSRRKRLWRDRQTLLNKLNRSVFINGVTLQSVEQEVNDITRALKEGVEIVFINPA